MEAETTGCSGRPSCSASSPSNSIGAYGEHPSPLVSTVHPALATAALVVAHLSLRWARSGARLGRLRRAGVGLLGVLVLLAGAVAAVSVGVRTAT